MRNGGFIVWYGNSEEGLSQFCDIYFGDFFDKGNILAPGNKYRKKNAALAVLMKKYYAENPNGVNPNRKLLSISGDYGEDLRRAVMELQEIWGLKKDGKFGPKSYEKLIYFLSLVYAHEAQRKHYE